MTGRNKYAVLLCRWGGLGDLMVTLPALNLIRKEIPGSPLQLVCRETYGSLLKETGVVDGLIPSDSTRLLPFFSGPPYPPGFEQWKKSYSKIMGWMVKGSLPPFGEFIPYDPESGLPISRFFFHKTAERLGCEKKGPAFDEYCLLPPLTDRKNAGRYGKFVLPFYGGEEYAVIHPGSGGEKKRWPLNRFLALSEYLSRKGVKGLLVTGEAEERLLPLLSGLPPGWKNLHCPPLSLLARFLSGCRFYLGNDSGATHLAAACGARVTALYLEENLPAWKPYGQTVVLEAPSLEKIEVEDVRRVIDAL